MAGRDNMDARRLQQQQPITSANAVPALSQPTPPSQINRTAPYPATQTVGGTQLARFPPFTSSTFGQIPAVQQIGYWKAQDQVPRPVRIKVAPTSLINTRTTGAGNELGIACKVTIGNERGSIVQWLGAPFVLNATASLVRVEATVCSVPFLFSAGQGSLGAFGPVTGNYGDTYTSTLSCLITDYACDAERPVCIVPPSPSGLANVLNFPAILDQVVFTNQSSVNTVLMACIDSFLLNGFETARNVLACTYVPPLSTVSIGSHLLAPVGSGLVVQGITNLNNFLTRDTNDSTIRVQVFGRILLPGGS